MRKRIQTILVVFAAGLVTSAPFVSVHAQATDPIVERQAMIRLQPGADIEDFNARYGTTVLRAVESRNIFLLLLPDDVQDEEEWADDVRADRPAGLIWVEANYEGQDGEGRTGSFYVSDINGEQEYRDQFPRQQQNLPGVHQVSTGDGVVIAVLDTGIDSTHEILAGRVLEGFNFIDNNTNTEDVGDDEDNDGDGLIDESFGHGTFVAGILAMMAPDSQLLPVKVLDSDGNGDNFIFAQAIFYAIDQDADVINMSLGSTYKSEVVEDAVDEARDNGIVIVAAVGNRNLNGDEGSGNDNPAREHPALISNVFGIASLGATDVKSPFSNYSSDVFLSAPGSGGIWSAIPMNDLGHNFAEWEGTSFATAITSGAVALLMAANPDLPRSEARWSAIEDCLEDTAIDIDDRNQQRHRGRLGEGRLNLPDAINCRLAETDLTDFQIITGTLLSGNLDSIEDSDNQYLRVRSGFGRTLSELHKMELLVGASTTETAPTSMEVRIESRISEQSGTARILLRNWSTGEFAQVGQYPIRNTDEVRIFFVINPALYVSGEGRIELLVKHIVFVPFLAFTFESFTDEIDLDAE